MLQSSTLVHERTGDVRIAGLALNEKRRATPPKLVVSRARSGACGQATKNARYHVGTCATAGSERRHCSRRRTTQALGAEGRIAGDARGRRVIGEYASRGEVAQQLRAGAYRCARPYAAPAWDNAATRVEHQGRSLRVRTATMVSVDGRVAAANGEGPIAVRRRARQAKRSVC